MVVTMQQQYRLHNTWPTTFIDNTGFISRCVLALNGHRQWQETLTWFNDTGKHKLLKV
jgi:hypothetical protein